MQLDEITKSIPSEDDIELIEYVQGDILNNQLYSKNVRLWRYNANTYPYNLPLIFAFVALLKSNVLDARVRDGRWCLSLPSSAPRFRFRLENGLLPFTPWVGMCG